MLLLVALAIPNMSQVPPQISMSTVYLRASWPASVSRFLTAWALMYRRALSMLTCVLAALCQAITCGRAKMWKKYCAITAATLCLLCCASASAASSVTTYTMTATEMSALDSRLTLLLQQTKVTRQALAESQAALTESRAELSKLKTESIKLQIELQAQSSLLESANRSLQASAKEEARTRRRIKAQRNTAIVTAVGLLAYAINK
nr:MAG TPA_asm: Peptidoglycan endopeptidase [Caudoviricetes sp.]